VPSSVDTSPVRPAAAVRVSEIEQLWLRLSDLFNQYCLQDQELAVVVDFLKHCRVFGLKALQAFLNAPFFESERKELASQLSKMANYCFFVVFKESLQASAAAASAADQEPVPADEFARLVVTQLLPYIGTSSDVNNSDREQVAQLVRESLLASVDSPQLRADLEYTSKLVKKSGNETNDNESTVAVSFKCFGCTKSGCGVRTLQLRPNTTGFSMPNKNFLMHIYKKKKTSAAESPQPTQMRRIESSSSEVSSSNT